MDKRIMRALAAVAKRYPNMPEIQRETVAAVMVLGKEGTPATALQIALTAGNTDAIQGKILLDLALDGVLNVASMSDSDGSVSVYTLATAKPRAPKIEIVASAPVNILDPAFLRVDAPPVDGAPPAIVGTFPIDADKGPESGPVAQAMLATAAVPVDAGPDDESALTDARARLATLATEIDAVKGEIRTIRARMRAAGKVDAGPGERVSYRASGERDPRLPAAGTVKEREYNGTTYTVEIGESDFGYDGARYKSLTAIANLILGRTNGVNGVNGMAWFGYADKRVSATPRAVKSTNATPAAPAKPAPLGFGAAIAAVKVASAPPTAVPAPEATPETGTHYDPDLVADASPASTPDADPFLADLQSMGGDPPPVPGPLYSHATPAPAPKSTKGKPGRTFSASKAT